jgi:hypothetical protein
MHMLQFCRSAILPGGISVIAFSLLVLLLVAPCCSSASAEEPSLDIIVTVVNDLETSDRFDVGHILDDLIGRTLTASPGARVHIISNDANVLEIAKVAGAYVGLVDEFDEGADRFRRVYKAQSVNPILYERWCFERWFVIGEYVDAFVKMGWPFTSMDVILAMDYDIVLLGDPVQLLEVGLGMTLSDVIQENITSVRAILGAMSFWTANGLREYTSFLQDVYASDNVGIVMSHGQRMESGDRPPERFVFIPPSPGDTEVYHFSDMHAYGAFRSGREGKLNPFVDKMTAQKASFHIMAKFNQEVRMIGSDGRVFVDASLEVGGECSLWEQLGLIHFNGGNKRHMEHFFDDMYQFSLQEEILAGRSRKTVITADEQAACHSELGRESHDPAFDPCNQLLILVGGLRVSDSRPILHAMLWHPGTTESLERGSTELHPTASGQLISPSIEQRKLDTERYCDCANALCWILCPKLTDEVTRRDVFITMMAHVCRTSYSSLAVPIQDPDFLSSTDKTISPLVYRKVVVIRHPWCSETFELEEWAAAWKYFLTDTVRQVRAHELILVRYEDWYLDPLHMSNLLFQQLGLSPLHHFEFGSAPFFQHTIEEDSDCPKVHRNINGQSSQSSGDVQQLLSFFGYSIDSSDGLLATTEKLRLFSAGDLLAMSTELLRQ